MKKQLFIYALLCGLYPTTNAQTYKVAAASSVKELEIIISNTHLDIQGHDGNEILITSKYNVETDERAVGLTTIYQTAEDNTGIGINLTQSTEKITLLKVSRRKEGSFLIRVPKKLHLVISENEWQGEEINITDMPGSIRVHANNSDISLKNVQGPVYAKTTSGDITGTFSNRTKIKQANISSVSGTIDISLPADLPANLDISSISGEIYSDFDLQLKKADHHKGLEKIGGGRKTKATINGGGIKLVFSSISDDVYVRKIASN
ncbi:DUF4097 family beta strand repeat-containing protein [Fulvivirgaceae bacterium BMA12]|uniref:DUF4097 family beta strand repeat-containing protein n=1 Tax=Agaribacillus aureus TaxID=3051825 RepID=A0ABT8LCU8_9BACT|nr:DUF4097 family beta strand repeat-containing protein [Fulvivirgaceae bacterium BMA12]